MKNRIKRLLCSKRGLTLVEMVCSLALLSVVFLGFTTLAVSAAKTNQRTTELDNAFYDSTNSLFSGGGSGTATIKINGQTIEVNINNSSTGYPLILCSPKGVT